MIADRVSHSSAGRPGEDLGDAAGGGAELGAAGGASGCCGSGVVDGGTILRSDRELERARELNPLPGFDVLIDPAEG